MPSLSTVILWHTGTGKVIAHINGVPVDVKPYEIVAVCCHVPYLKLDTILPWKSMGISRMHECDTPEQLKSQTPIIYMNWRDLTIE